MKRRDRRHLLLTTTKLCRSQQPKNIHYRRHYLNWSKLWVKWWYAGEEENDWMLVSWWLWEYGKILPIHLKMELKKSLFPCFDDDASLLVLTIHIILLISWVSCKKYLSSLLGYCQGLPPHTFIQTLYHTCTAGGHYHKKFWSYLQW